MSPRPSTSSTRRRRSRRCANDTACRSARRRCSSRCSTLPFCAVIPGALSVAEVKQNIAHMSVKIPVELWSELKSEKLLDAAAPTPN